MAHRILIADDEKRIRQILVRLLENKGYICTEAEDGEQVIQAVAESAPDLILLDLKMPKKTGLDTFKELRSGGFDGNVIILTAFGTIPSAIEAMRLGAFEYVSKPFESEELLLLVERALEQSRLKSELKDARQRLDSKFSIGGIISDDPAIKRLLETVVRVAPTDMPVLITGESGTGKELFANAIHQHSRRKNGPFIALNCSALPENLIESELFGYKKGAFSGAQTSKPGLVEQADAGTLFLDEISEMGFELQAKLLRFTQSGEYIAVGDTTPRKVDVRLLAASNKELQDEIAEGRFRQDLFYRLNVLSIAIPPLRERDGDIPVLIDHFLKKYPSPHEKEPVRFSAEAMAQMCAYQWPGNVRELENAVKSSVVMARENPIEARALPKSISSRQVPFELPAEISPLPEMINTVIESVERQAIIHALQECGGNQTRAAELLGIGRRTLVRKISQYKISKY